MIAKAIMGLWIGLSLTALALADNRIEEWGGAPNIQYTIYQEEHMIVLESPGTFKFWAYDPADPNRPPGHIESITVAPGVTGVINVYIAHPDGPEFWGAQDVDVVNLSGQAETNIGELRTYGNLAADAAVWATRLTGTCAVRGDILHDVQVASLFGELRCRTMRNLTVTDPTPGPAGTRIAPGPGPPGNLTRSGPVGASLLKPGQVPDCIEPTTRLEFVWSRSGRARHVVRPEEVDK